MSDQYLNNYQKISRSSKLVSERWGRSEPDLLVVSKRQMQVDIISFIKSTHHMRFAENYVKEAEEKYTTIKKSYPNLQLHLIGHLQSNKAIEAVKLFDVIETVDSYKLASKLDAAEKITKLEREYLIQVNIGFEEQKYGVMPDDLKDLLAEIRNNLTINIKGLMCIPPKDKNPSIYFAYLKKLAQDNKLSYLSMGMSSDYQEAIAVGTDEIRIGTALFA
ncbi:MAG: YggS family pyridoxal phosphate-dependent enzyme [Rickettsiales bacterium]|jgi:PLP dependent protein|nr:YggS family pyridoxal phosphate-dependent enzyme [Rickettsiales bacterium]